MSSPIIGEIQSRARRDAGGVCCTSSPTRRRSCRSSPSSVELVVDPTLAGAQVQALDRRGRVGTSAPGRHRGGGRPLVGARRTGARRSRSPAGRRWTPRPSNAPRRSSLGAERPLIVVGGGAQDAGDAVAALATLLQAPVTTRRMGHGVIPTAHPLFAPLPVGYDLWADADVVVGIGTPHGMADHALGHRRRPGDHQDRHRRRRARPSRRDGARHPRRRTRRLPRPRRGAHRPGSPGRPHRRDR